ncbi:hypothetical protein COO60DRAFT_1629554 [Scenedesmus sp. NREL 46B-D3]|nr:hypothetical protein COO60DRAFT_1629554 [Scenedesmus sp. NREL 46B-D3]
MEAAAARREEQMRVFRRVEEVVREFAEPPGSVGGSAAAERDASSSGADSSDGAGDAPGGRRSGDGGRRPPPLLLPPGSGLGTPGAAVAAAAAWIRASPAQAQAGAEAMVERARRRQQALGLLPEAAGPLRLASAIAAAERGGVGGSSSGQEGRARAAVPEHLLHAGTYAQSTRMLVQSLRSAEREGRAAAEYEHVAERLRQRFGGDAPPDGRAAAAAVDDEDTDEEEEYFPMQRPAEPLSSLAAHLLADTSDGPYARGFAVPGHGLGLGPRERGAGGPRLRGHRSGAALSYEQLVNLEDVKVCVPDAVLARLPRRVVAPLAAAAAAAAAGDGVGRAAAAGEADGVICPVCQCELGGPEPVVTLPCGHDYHDACVRRWLGSGMRQAASLAGHHWQGPCWSWRHGDRQPRRSGAATQGLSRFDALAWACSDRLTGSPAAPAAAPAAPASAESLQDRALLVGLPLANQVGVLHQAVPA